MKSLVSVRRALLAVLLSLSAVTAQAGELTVSAASSLSQAFKELARSFEAGHPGAKVRLNFGASGALLQQMAKGAPVDVFASADEETMEAAISRGLVAAGERRDFARNTLVLVVPSDSPFALGQLEDLTQPGVRRIALGNPASVPVGRYARRALEAARLWQPLQAKAIPTQHARQALDYVARGEVEAGFVYATDAAVMPDKVRVAFTVPLYIPIRYPVARLAGSAHAEEAARFIDYVRSPAGLAILGRHGFLKP